MAPESLHGASLAARASERVRQVPWCQPVERCPSDWFVGSRTDRSGRADVGPGSGAQCCRPWPLRLRLVCSPTFRQTLPSLLLTGAPWLTAERIDEVLRPAVPGGAGGVQFPWQGPE